MAYVFHQFLYRPLLNILVLLYNSVAFHDLGVAIILLTLVIRFLLYPLFKKSLRHQAVMRRIQPHVKRIQKEHKDNREKQAKELLALYKEHNINPFSSFFLLLAQLPVLIALYRVFLKGISSDTFADLYSWVHAPANISHLSFGLINLQKPFIVIVALAAIAQYIQAKVSSTQLAAGAKGDPAGEMAARMSRQMAFLGPVLTLVFLIKLPSAIGMYWLTTSVFTIIQQVVITRSLNNEHGSISNKSETNS